VCSLKYIYFHNILNNILKIEKIISLIKYNHMNYIDKYKPEKSSDFIGHFKFTNEIKKHLKSNNLNKLILCIGSSGIGKTEILNKILKELSYNIININDPENYKEEINNYLNTKSIDSFFTKKKKILLIDDLDIYLSNDKQISNFLLSLELKQPIICILNKQYDRKAIDIKKKSEIFYLNKPNFNTTLQYIIKILDNENVDIDSIRLENTKKLIKHNKNNIKSILMNIENIILNNGKLNNYCLYENKFNDIGLFDVINNFYSNKYKLDELDNLVHSDSSLIYMLLHENLIDEINRRKINDEELLTLLSNIINDSCEGDIIQGFIYKNNNWEMLSLLYIIQIFRLNKNINDYTIKNKEIKYKFTQMLTKYSLKCNYNKKKLNLLEKNKLSDNYFDVIVQNILYLLKNQDINNGDTINKILQDNNINKENIDVLIKYNKILEIMDIKNLNKIKKKLN
tara:strand:- start:5585 stop:6949 length:1365 start_codon:yes stop_codon:yes gene_type:complete